MNAVAIAADQIMPVGQRFASFAQHISAGRRQPFETADFALGQPQTVGHERSPVLVVATLRRLHIEQFARDIGRINPAGVVILDLVQAAFAATVAKRLPLRVVQCFERSLPERQDGHLTGPIWQGPRSRE